jgi:hypothetical protein
MSVVGSKPTNRAGLATSVDRGKNIKEVITSADTVKVE